MVDQPALVHQLRSLYPYLAFDFYDGLFYNVIMNDKESKRIYDANLTPEMHHTK